MPKKQKEIEKNQGLYFFKNADKGFHEKWSKDRHPMNIPHPFRAVIAGRPNCGKSTMIKNLLMFNKPFFKEIIVVHCDPEYTKEYEDLGEEIELISEIPPPEGFTGKEKTLVILDDLEYKNLNKLQRKNLDRLFGFVSTHKNISVCLTAQDVFNIPTGVRRCANIWMLWRVCDLDALLNIARKLNYSAKQLKFLFDNYVKTNHDFIMIDNTNKTPYPLRRNGLEFIDSEQIKMI